jgi:hypothetical protein
VTRGERRRLASFEMTGSGVVKKRRRLASFEMTGSGVVKKRHRVAAFPSTRLRAGEMTVGRGAESKGRTLLEAWAEIGPVRVERFD